jgi:dihydrofolate reductase
MGWGTSVIATDVEAAIRELKAPPGQELQIHASGVLLRQLLSLHLVAELTTFTFPVVVGQGARLFPEAGPTYALALVESQVSPSGVTIQTFPLPAVKPQARGA